MGIFLTCKYSYKMMTVTKRYLSKKLTEAFEVIGYDDDHHETIDGVECDEGVLQSFLDEWCETVNDKNDSWFVYCEYDKEDKCIRCSVHNNKDLYISTKHYEDDFTVIAIMPVPTLCYIPESDDDDSGSTSL